MIITVTLSWKMTVAFVTKQLILYLKMNHVSVMLSDTFSWKTEIVFVTKENIM